MRLSQHIKKTKQDPWDRIAFGCCALALGVWSILLAVKYINFGYYDWDLAYFNQLTWNLLHGNPRNSLFDVSLFSNHSNFIAYACLPVYFLAPHPMTLVMLKVISFIAGGYLLYHIGKTPWGARTSLLLMGLYFIYPGNIFGILYEFDFESLSPAFLFLLYLFYAKNQLRNFLITAVFTILIKENMPLIIAAFGIAAFFKKDRNNWLWGTGLTILGFGSFYLLTSVIIPSFREGNVHGYIEYYAQFGKSPMEIVISLITRPWEIIPYLLDAQNKKFLFELFAPLFFLSWGSPHILFLGSPIFIQHLLSYAHTEHTIYYQYVLSLSPFIFLAAGHTIAMIRQFLRPPSVKIIILTAVLFSCISFNRYISWFIPRLSLQSDHLNNARWAMVHTVPKDAPVIASFDFLAELSGRKEIYAFHKVYHFDHRDAFNMPGHVEWALIDFSDRWLEAVYLTDPLSTAQYIQNFFTENAWGVFHAAENIILFKRGEGQKIIEIDTAAPHIRYNDIYCQMTDLLLVRQAGKTSLTVNGGQFLPMHLEWFAKADIVQHYFATLVISQGPKVVAQKGHFIGYKMFPTLLWKKNMLIRERIWLHIPDLPPGQYDIKLILTDALTNRAEPVMPKLTTLTIK